jgi:hypothetical protein
VNTIDTKIFQKTGFVGSAFILDKRFSLVFWKAQRFFFKARDRSKDKVFPWRASVGSGS